MSKFFANFWFFQYGAKSGLAEGLAPEDSPHIKQKEMMMQPLGNSSRAGTARPGRLWWYNKKTEFCAFLS